MYFGFVLYSSQGVYYLYTEGNKEIQWSEDIKFSLKWKLLFLKNENFKDYEISTEFHLERNINWNTDVKKKKKEIDFSPSPSGDLGMLSRTEIINCH